MLVLNNILVLNFFQWPSKSVKFLIINVQSENFRIEKGKNGKFRDENIILFWQMSNFSDLKKKYFTLFV